MEDDEKAYNIVCREIRSERCKRWQSSEYESVVKARQIRMTLPSCSQNGGLLPTEHEQAYNQILSWVGCTC